MVWLWSHKIWIWFQYSFLIVPFIIHSNVILMFVNEIQIFMMWASSIHKYFFLFSRRIGTAGAAYACWNYKMTTHLFTSEILVSGFLFVLKKYQRINWFLQDILMAITGSTNGSDAQHSLGRLLYWGWKQQRCIASFWNKVKRERKREKLLLRAPTELRYALLP